MSDTEGNLKAHENLPFIRIRSDWQDGIRKGEKVWISCHVQGKKPIYGNILSNGARNYSDMHIEVDHNDFTAELLSTVIIKVSSVSQNVSSVFHAPFSTFRNLHKKAVRCVDVSPGGALGISSSDDGSLNIWNTSDGVVRRCLEGHISDVTHCRFFPSGVVALSGGIDMRLRIWSVENGSCPRVLVGHSAAITDTAIIDKGKTFVSCSRDGTAKLWDCGEGKCKQTLVDTQCVINSCALEACNPGIFNDQTPMEGTGEDGLGGRALLIAREDGILEAIDIHSGTQIFRSNCHSAINCCDFVNEHQIIGGCENGTIFCFDLRNGASASSTYSMGESSVHHLKVHNNKIFVARGDGSLQIYNPFEQNVKETLQLTGPDDDPIYRFCCYGEDVYSACRDGVIRKYCLDPTKWQFHV
ncbi:proteasomal ATPase-associated factor 1-like isoform X3 [Rhopilema esculentum]|uniref:proteasomal ATPase-associated factor 1-like isoform X3 n=1 Tax=Rhopilema esculentum TaxID=499914 RepID=UPI0031D3E17F